MRLHMRHARQHFPVTAVRESSDPTHIELARYFLIPSLT